MKRFIHSSNRTQGILLLAQLDDYVTEENPVMVIDVFVDELDLAPLGFEGVTPADTCRLAYHPADQFKLYIYGHLNRIQSSRRPFYAAHELLQFRYQIAGEYTDKVTARVSNKFPSSTPTRSFVRGNAPTLEDLLGAI